MGIQMTTQKELNVGDYFTVGDEDAAHRYLGQGFMTKVEINKTLLLVIAKTGAAEGNYYVIEKTIPKLETKIIHTAGFNALKGTLAIMKDTVEQKQNQIRALLTNPGTGMFTVGTDPEMFVMKGKTVIPAFDFLGEKPKILTQTPKAYWDGFQAEYNTQPSSCLAWQIDNIRNGMYDLHNQAKKIGGKLTIKSVVGVPLSKLAKLPKDKTEFGCTPSLNAYGEAMPIPDGKDVNFRMAGGHLHLGSTALMRHGKDAANLENTDILITNVIKSLDRTLGVLSVALFYGLEDKRRRSLYGRAGEYRTPKHGIEYRVLSNAWMVHPVTANLIFELARVIAGTTIEGKLRGKRYNFLEDMNTTDEEVQDIINNLDIRKARTYIKQHENLFKAMLLKVTLYPGLVDQWYNLILRGVSTRLRKDHSLEKAWCLEGGWVNHNESEGRNIKRFSEMMAAQKAPETLLLTG